MGGQPHCGASDAKVEALLLSSDTIHSARFFTRGLCLLPKEKVDFLRVVGPVCGVEQLGDHMADYTHDRLI